MVNFDSPNREKCTVFENRTNTPLQALKLMNDVTFLEAARKLAERMIDGGRRVAGRARGYGYRLVLARAPDAARRQALLKALRRFLGDLSRRRRRGARVPQAGRIAGAAGLDARGTGGIHRRGQPDPESRRDDHEGISMNGMTRRHFFGVNSTGVGLAALAGLWAAMRAPRPTAGCPACRISRRRPSASSTCSNRAALRRWNCSTTSRGCASSRAPNCRSPCAAASGSPACRRRNPASRWCRRSSRSRSTASPARGSASCCRTRRRSSTT